MLVVADGCHLDAGRGEGHRRQEPELAVPEHGHVAGALQLVDDVQARRQGLGEDGRVVGELLGDGDQVA